MVSPWLIYLIGTVDKVGRAAAFIAIALLFSLAIGVFSFSVNSLKVLKIPFIIAVISGLIAIFIPSSKTVAAMIIIPPVLNNEQVQQFPSNVLEFVNEYLKEAKKSFKGEK